MIRLAVHAHDPALPDGILVGTVDKIQGKDVLVVLVCNPALLTVRCRTPEQMRLANAMARFVELARMA